MLQWWKSRTSFDSLRDGLSKTLLIGEVTKNYSEANQAYNGDRNGGGLLGPMNPLQREDEVAAGININGFGSDHTGICQFVMADGSVHSIAVETSPTVLGHLVTRAGGEVISGDY